MCSQLWVDLWCVLSVVGGSVVCVISCGWICCVQMCDQLWVDLLCVISCGWICCVLSVWVGSVVYDQLWLDLVCVCVCVCVYVISCGWICCVCNHLWVDLFADFLVPHTLWESSSI